MIEDKIRRALGKDFPVLTDFLDPAQADAAEIVIRKSEQRGGYQFFGGTPDAERVRLLIYPQEYQPEEEEFHLSVVTVKNRKMKPPLTHRDVLGALMGSGIRREKVGDIFVDDEGAAIIADSTMAEFIAGTFPPIRQQTFETEILPVSAYPFPQLTLRHLEIQIPSYRLDILVAKVYHLSRTDAQELIRKGKVRINHKPAEKPDAAVKEGALVSVRTKGRFIVGSESGKTKKGNIRIGIAIYG